MSTIAEDYAEGTARAWDRKMGDETASEERATQERELRHERNSRRRHPFSRDWDAPQFCYHCGLNYMFHDASDR